MSATQWLTDSKVFWTGVPEALPKSDEAWTPLRGLIQSRLAVLPRGVYAVSATYPDPVRKAPDGGRPRPVVDQEVDRLTALSRQTLAETARAVSLAAQFPVVLRKRLGDVGAWRERCEHALREASVLARAVDGASDLASLLALEEGCVMIGAGPAPSASVDLDALAEWLRSQQGATAPGVRVAAVILGQRGCADGVPHRWAEWSRLGRALTQWPPSYVLSISRALDGAWRPGEALETLNTGDITWWLDEVMLGPGSGPAPEDILGLCGLLKALDRVRHEPLRRLRIAAALRREGTREAGHAEAAGLLGEALAAVGVPAPIAHDRPAPAHKGMLQRWVILPRGLPERLRGWLPQGLHTRGVLRCMQRGGWQEAMALLEGFGMMPDPQGRVAALVLAGRLTARGVAHAEPPRSTARAVRQTSRRQFPWRAAFLPRTARDVLLVGPSGDVSTGDSHSEFPFTRRRPLIPSSVCGMVTVMRRAAPP